MPNIETKIIATDALAIYQIYENDIIIFNCSDRFDTKVKFQKLKAEGRNVSLQSGDVEMCVTEFY
jgi:hypothetical protein